MARRFTFTKVIDLEHSRRQIWQAELHKQGSNIVDAYKGAEFFYAGFDKTKGLACVWYILDDDRTEKESFEIFVAKDWRPFDDRPMDYIGTATEGINFWHVFKVRKG